jgi:uncharacterized protein (DUF58 family)
MSGWTLVGLALLAGGALLGAPGLILVGALTIVSRWLTTIWSRYGLAAIGYARRLGTDRAMWGDRIPLDVEVWNRKLLPVPLLEVDDFVTDALRIVGRPLQPSDRPGQASMRNAWSLLWYERVVRHATIDAARRGAFTFGPVRLTVSDIFERGTRSVERPLPDELVVRPRNVPVGAAQPARAPLGAVRARSSLFHDASRYAGVRAYRPGDPLRHIHWRATARLPSPVSRRYEPVHERAVLLAVDMQTVEGPHWLMQYDDEQVEALCVAAASLARRLARDGAACGLLVGAQLVGGRRWAFLAPETSRGQLARIEDLLARVQPLVTIPFERLLAAVPRRLQPGATLLTLGARSPRPYAPVLRRLDRGGYRVMHLASGTGAAAACALLRDAGLAAARLELEPDWRTADALVVAR